MACLSHRRYRGVLLWNDVTVDWLSVGSWFGTFSAPGAGLRACGLVRLQFVAQTMWFSMPGVCGSKGE